MNSLNRERWPPWAGTMPGLTVIALSIGTAASEGAQGGGKTARHAGGARRLRLSGQVRGTWVRQPGVPDVGGTYQLNGSGSNSQGSLTLALTGRMQHGFSQPPTRLVFSVTSGTGRYQGRPGAGVAQLTLTPQRRPPRPGQVSPHFIAAAMFTMKFSDRE